MREALKRLTGESLIYGIGQVGGRAVQLLLVPVLTRLLTKEAFAVSDLVLAYSQTAILVLVFGLDGALARFFYQEPDREARIRMVSSSFAFRIVLSTAAALALMALSGPISVNLMGSEAYRKYVLIGAVTLPFTLLVMFANDVLRVTFQPWKFIALNVTQTVAIGGVSLWLVWVRHAGVVGVFYGRLIADVACAALGLVLVRHTLRPRFSRESLRRMLRYGAPLVPGAFAYGFITGIDRFVLQKTRTLDEVAIYAVATKFFAVVSLGIAAFQLAYGPFAFARARSPEAPRLFARVFGLYVTIASFGALAVSLFAPEVLALLVPGSYAAAAAPAQWLAFAAVAQGAYSVASVGVALALRTSLLGWTSAAAALVAIGGQFALTPRWGPPGTAVATFLGYSASALLTYRVSQRVYPLPFRGGRFLLAMLSALGLAITVQRLSPGGPEGIAVKLAALGGHLLACASLGLWRDRGAVSGPAATG